MLSRSGYRKRSREMETAHVQRENIQTHRLVHSTDLLIFVVDSFLPPPPPSPGRSRMSGLPTDQPRAVFRLAWLRPSLARLRGVHSSGVWGARQILFQPTQDTEKQRYSRGGKPNLFDSTPGYDIVPPRQRMSVQGRLECSYPQVTPVIYVSSF